MKSTLATEWYLTMRRSMPNGLYRHIFRTADNKHKIILECSPDQAVDRLLYNLPEGATYAGSRL